MTRINPSDQALLLLRAQLKRISATRSEQTGRTARAGTKAPLARAAALASQGALSQDDLNRTMVRALLAEELGDRFASDPNFQRIVEDVFRILSDDEETRSLMAQAGQQLLNQR